MGTENIWLVCACGFSAFLANCLYCMGGTAGFTKVLRRYVAPIILTLALNLSALYLETWRWQFILVLPLLIGGFHLGYSATTTWKKILRRTLYALAVVSSCLACVWGTGFTLGGCIIFGLAVFTGLTSVALGVWNPFNSARVEEFLVSQVLTLYIVFWGFVR